MRRLTLGVCILALGTLLALPFRRPVGDLPDPTDGEQANGRHQILDDQSLQLLVEEVTRDVEIPTAFDPQTDYSQPKPATPVVSLPLTYEDIAVPVQGDPLYEQRFNATAEVASRNLDRVTTQDSVAATSPTSDPRASRFTSKPAVDPSIANLLGRPVKARPISASAGGGRGYPQQIPSLPPPDVRTPIANGGISDFPTAKPASANPSERSVLSPLPPPDDAESSVESPREHHWIRQPD